MTAVTEQPTSPTTGDRHSGFLILADASLYTLQNWLQAVAIAFSGLLLVWPNTVVRTRWVAGGVTIASSGLLLGSAVVAVKHWRPYGGMAIGYERW